MALAGKHEIIITVIDRFRRPASQMRRQRRRDRRQTALTFLAAKAATHTAGFDGHGMIAHAENVGDLVLDLAWMLGRGMDQHIAILTRKRQRCLALEIEMLLSANIDTAAEGARRRCDGRIRIAARHGRRRPQKRACLHRRLDGYDRRQLLIADFGKANRSPGRRHRLGGNGKHRLADIIYLGVGKNRIIAIDRRTVILSRNICGAHHPCDAGRGGNSRQIHRGDARMRMRTLRNQHHKAIFGGNDVIDIDRGTGNMFVRTVMAQRGTDVTGNTAGRLDVLAVAGIGRCHHIPRAPASANPDRPARRTDPAPVRSSPYFTTRLRATCNR